MHILIGLITAIGGLVWALYRLHNAGVNLNSFNPFYWLRRRRWEKQFGTKPIHRLESSMEAAALLVVGAAALEGEITRELKSDILKLFVEEFGITEQNALQYYSSSSHLLGDVMDINAEVKNILAPSKAQFQDTHKKSLLTMLNNIIKAESQPNESQSVFVQTVERELVEGEVSGKW